MFLQIHTLTSYPASLLNRDDVGLAKRIPFGNATRLRISSQCLKRHWREQLVAELPDVPDGLRTRQFFSRAIYRRLLSEGISEEASTALCEALLGGLVTGGGKGVEMSQPVLFGVREAEFMVELAVRAHSETDSASAAVDQIKKWLADKEQKKNLNAMSKAAAGLTAAMFGRFVTSDILARVDAPVHVAHAFTVHASQTEMDYFTVVDDLNRDDEAGAAHANEAELGAGLYYGYVVVDVPLLVSNLTGCERSQWRSQDPSPARRVLEALVPTIATRSPGAKLGSTAPYSVAELVLLEAGAGQPRTLANAYLKALPLRDDPMQRAVDAMATHLRAIDDMYGATASARTLATVKRGDGFDIPSEPIAAATRRTLDHIFAQA